MSEELRRVFSALLAAQEVSAELVEIEARMGDATPQVIRELRLRADLLERDLRTVAKEGAR